MFYDDARAGRHAAKLHRQSVSGPSSEQFLGSRPIVHGSGWSRRAAVQCLLCLPGDWTTRTEEQPGLGCGSEYGM